METPDLTHHVAQHDNNLGTPRRDPALATDAETLIDGTQSHEQKVLMHAISSMNIEKMMFLKKGNYYQQKFP